MLAVTHALTNTRLARFWPYLITISLSLTALTRWFRAELPLGADTAIHVLRAVQLEWAIRNGELYPRWSPDLVFGYGYPLFNVHGPAAHYVIVALHALGPSFIQATLWTFALADVVGALGAFVLARSLLGTPSGFVAALGYAYAPYVLGSLYRGSPAEALALALLPWLLWAFYRLFHAPAEARAPWLAFAAGLYALFPLLHNPSTVLASGLLLFFGLALAAAVARSPREALLSLRTFILASLLGLALSAFYWLPALAETRFIQIERAYGPPVLNYRYNFLTLAEVFSLPQPYDPYLIGVSAPRSLGWPQLILAAFGLLAFRYHSREQKMLVALSAVAAAVLTMLTLPQALWAWDHLPGLSLIQFPARLLGPASLLLALLAGAAGRPSPPPRRGPASRVAPPLPLSPARGRGEGEGLGVGVRVSLIACTLYGITWMFNGADPFTPPNPTLADIYAFERRTGSLGTTTAGEYLPIGVKEIPPTDSLQERYAEGAPIRRLNPASLPPGARVLEQTPGFTHEIVRLESPEDFTATFDVFDFPGWQATVDGQPATITPSSPYGLITVPVPAGPHTVEIRFGTTPIRAAGAVISLIGLAVWLVLVARRLTQRATTAASTDELFSPRLALGLGLTAAALFAFKLGVVDRQATFFAHTRFDGESLAGAQTPLAIDFSDQLQLLGYDQAQASVRADEPLNVTLYWRVLQPLDTDYSTSLVVVDDAGGLYGQSDSQHPAGYPTSRWPLSHYGSDAHLLKLTPGTPPGVYRLIANVYHPGDLAALTTGKEIGDVTVTRPARPADLQPAQPLEARFGPITLLGVDLPWRELSVGTDLPITLFWKAESAPGQDLALRVAFVDSAGRAALEQDLPPVRADYPTRSWASGETLLAQQRVRIPPDLAGGDYALRVSVHGESDPIGEAVSLGTVRVVAPERTFTLPSMAHASGARFGDVAELAGWSLEGNQLTLAWRALGTAGRGYKVFVHVLNPDGTIFSQRDAPPLSGARPTTSWLAGEVLVDEYTLDIPEGVFSIAVGMYDQVTGERLKLETGDDRLELK